MCKRADNGRWLRLARLSAGSVPQIFLPNFCGYKAREIFFGEKVRQKYFFSVDRKFSWTENLPALVIFAQTILKYTTRRELIIRKNSD